jgi:hypothetical protein
MKLIHRSVALAVTAALALGMAASASAAVISFGGTVMAGQGETTSVASATVYDFNSGAKPASYASAGAGSDGAVLTGNLSGKYAAPAGDSSQYLSVAWPSAAGTQTAAPGGGYNYFGLYWGSMDEYNTLAFYRNGNFIESVTGANVILAGTQLGDQMAAGSNRYVNFNFGSSTFDTVVFSTNGYAFESDNHAFGTTSVPEPATLGLLGLGLVGASLAKRRRKLT